MSARPPKSMIRLSRDNRRLPLQPEDASFCSLRGTGGVDLSNPGACACGGRWRSPAATSTDGGRHSAFSPLLSGVGNVRTPDTWGVFGHPNEGNWLTGPLGLAPLPLAGRRRRVAFKWANLW
ncbi:hypothetical protein E2562_017348 [Oryza meyeriana var. granulata]|uniref:Uncharacterized protein n=1 Tax=Oryza meyeriana var. granulata TaxID=110450 RepID=A0A6G1BX94_9ORYZ|nr:hypothetical protein E2562_017348 [Oryza meyeriana var. granulata]